MVHRPTAIFRGNLTPCPPRRQAVNTLLGMGFVEARAVEMLEAAGGDVDGALQLLLS